MPCHGIADAYFESSLLIVPDILFFGRAEIREMGDRVAVRSQRKWLMVAAALLLWTPLGLAAHAMGALLLVSIVVWQRKQSA